MKLFQRKKNGPWWIDFTVGRTRVRRSLKVRDGKAAASLAAELVAEYEERLAGTYDPTKDHASVPVTEHLEEFLTSLDAAGVTPQHRAERERRLRRFFDHGKIKTLADVDLDTGAAWIAEQAKNDVSARTLNAGIAALRQWGRWLLNTERVQRNPFPATALRLRNVEEDRRRVRRALSDDEAARLVQAARKRPLERAAELRKRKGVSAPEQARLTFLGRTRALAYDLALGTGLRPGEGRSLRWADVLWATQELRIAAKHAKSRREQRVPLRQDLVDALEAYREAAQARGHPTGPTSTVIPARMYPSHRCFRRDLAAAKIEREDEEGRVVDRHALRHTFITRLARANVHPRTAQELARHSSIELTMKYYTHLRSRDLLGAVEKAGCAANLPQPVPDLASRSSSSRSTALRPTGTEGDATAAKARNVGPEGGGRNRT